MDQKIWDAGSLGCGELILELRSKIAEVAPGETLRVTTKDPGAVEDVPSWCRMTGHILEKAEPPNYWIRRKAG